MQRWTFEGEDDLASVRRLLPFGLLLAAALLLLACGPARLELPPDSPFAELTAVHHGVAIGDVTNESAVLWFRTVGPSTMEVAWEPISEVTAEAGQQASRITTDAEHDFTARVVLAGLRADTEYRYAIRAADQKPEASVVGTFRTAPLPEAETTVTFVWGADLGGQQQCRRGSEGYPIFEVMRPYRPAFVLLLGDLIYADGPCPAPPNAPGADFVARTLDGYRAKHRYQRGAVALQRFLAAVPVYATWDDHEVRNNFAGPYESLMPLGRQAFFEYWPIRPVTGHPWRLYRRFRWGRALELFVLDTRQYRSSNASADGPEKSMLGVAQRDWLVEAVTHSTAVWKVIATSVPLSTPKGGTLRLPGNDSWALGNDGTGFFTELREITDRFRAAHVRNVVWLAADVHFAQALAYDPDRDGDADFHEFVTGPLASGVMEPVPPIPALNPTSLYSGGGFTNFGVVTADAGSLQVEIVDERGVVRFRHVVHSR